MCMVTAKQIENRLKDLYKRVNEPKEEIQVYSENYLTRLLRILIEKGYAQIEFIEDDELFLAFDDSEIFDEENCEDCKDCEDCDKYNSKDQLSHINNGLFCIYLDGYAIYGFRARLDNYSFSFLLAMTKEVAKYIVEKTKKLDAFEKKELPNNGIYRIIVRKSMFGSYLDTTPIESIPTITAIHPCKEELENDLKFYFNNLSIFSKFGQKPLRKYLLHGEPGTGKTSICYDVAKEYKDEAIIAFCTDLYEVQEIMKACAEEDRKVIVIFEDCENSFYRANSDTLNFLDGIDRPLVKKGAAILMTTNHPERIEDRILKRPGRIDKLLHIDAVHDEESAYNLFLLYFKDMMEEAKFDYNSNSTKSAISIIASYMTGAQIKELSNSYISYIVSNNKNFDLFDIWECRVKMFNAFDVKPEEDSISFDYKKNEKLLMKALRK